jgi:hypothetical protein
MYRDTGCTVCYELIFRAPCVSLRFCSGTHLSDIRCLQHCLCFTAFFCSIVLDYLLFATLSFLGCIFCHICLSYRLFAALYIQYVVVFCHTCLRCSSVYSSACLRLYSASSISEIFVFVSRWSCTYPCVHNTIFPRLCFAFLVTDIRVFRSLHFGCCALHRYPLCRQLDFLRFCSANLSPISLCLQAMSF